MSEVRTGQFSKAVFIAYLGAMFFNAFVDLGHKTVIQNTVFKVYDGQAQVALIAVVNSLIILPYILLFTPVGFFSTKYAKASVMRATAWLAVLWTLLITSFYAQGWYQAAFVMTLLMGAQSAVYSPAKYGYLRELVGKERLGWGNGYVQAVTISAILAGTFAFSILFEWRYTTDLVTEADIVRQMWPLGGLLVLSALMELMLVYRLPVIDKGQPALEFDWPAYRGGQLFQQNLRTLCAHRLILISAIGLAGFWGISQMAIATFPAVGKARLDELNTIVIQGILAMSGVGIFTGALVAGRLSKNRIQTGLIPLGALMFGLALLFIPVIETRLGFALAFLLLGFFGACFIVPASALIQYHAKASRLGRTLASNGWLQNVTMLVFLLTTFFTARLGVVPRYLFYLMAAVALGGTAFFFWQHRKATLRFLLTGVFRLRYRVDIQGDVLPDQLGGGVLLLGNHISWIDWALLQLTSERQVRFVIDRLYYQHPLTGWFIRLFGAIPISPRASKEAIQKVRAALLAGEVVALFPEGAISHDGKLGKFRAGYELAVAGTGATVLPFAINGVWGSVFSRLRQRLTHWRIAWRRNLPRRLVGIRFAAPLDDSASVDEVRDAVKRLLG